jgi:hypothetical protein
MGIVRPGFMAGADEKDDAKRAQGKLARAARRVDASPALLTAAKLVREMLPGDSQSATRCRPVARSSRSCSGGGWPS